MTDTRAIPEINEETSLLILEKLIEIRNVYRSKVYDADCNGMYHSNETDKIVLNDINVVLKWVAAGGFE